MVGINGAVYSMRAELEGPSQNKLCCRIVWWRRWDRLSNDGESALSSDSSSVTETSRSRVEPIIFLAVKVQFIDTAGISGPDASPPERNRTEPQAAPATAHQQWSFSTLPSALTTRSQLPQNLDFVICFLYTGPKWGNPARTEAESICWCELDCLRSWAHPKSNHFPDLGAIQDPLSRVFLPVPRVLTPIQLHGTGSRCGGRLCRSSCSWDDF